MDRITPDLRLIPPPQKMVFFNDSVFVCVFVFLDTLQLLASLFVLLSSPLLSFLDTLQLLGELFILHYFL